ncbi:MAG: hypothetical protein Q8M83_03610 [bacterium]|nr:hypothetical protein [bacterium]
MHNHNGKKNRSMMWMMLICILFLGVLSFAGGKLFSGGYLGPIFVGVFVIAHLWMMFKGHGEHSDANTEKKYDLPAATSTAQAGAASVKQPEAKDEHKHGGCCH